MKWLKLVVYLGLSYVILAIAFPKAQVWVRLLLGPAGWTADPPHPLLWSALTLVTFGFLVGLVADVGFGLWKVPRWANMAFIVVFGVTLAGFRAEQGAMLGRYKTGSEVHPAIPLSAELGRLQQALAGYYRQHAAFPDTEEAMSALLALEDGALPEAPYLYKGLSRRPLSVQVRTGATGPVDEVPDGALPGTFLYAVSPRRDTYWLTVVAGDGVPVAARLLEGADGLPAVVSNAPFRWGGR